MTPQIDCLGKTSTVLRVSTQMGGRGVTYGSVANCINKEYMTWYLLYPIDSFLHMSDSCWVNLGMWPLKSIALEKWPKTCTLNLQLLHNTKRPRKWSGHMKMIDPPRELLHRHDTMLPSILLVWIHLTQCIYIQEADALHTSILHLFSS